MIKMVIIAPLQKYSFEMTCSKFLSSNFDWDAENKLLHKDTSQFAKKYTNNRDLKEFPVIGPIKVKNSKG